MTVDEVKAFIDQIELIIKGWPSVLQVLILCAAVVTSIITVINLRSNFRPLLNFKIVDEEDISKSKQTEEKIRPLSESSSKSKIHIKNIGSRTARKVRVKSSSFLSKNIVIEPGSYKTISVLNGGDLSDLKVTYKRSNLTFLFYTARVRENEKFLSKKKTFSPSSDITNIAGRKKFRKYLKKASKIKWPDDRVEIILFDCVDYSQISILNQGIYTDFLNFTNIFESSVGDVLFDLTEVFGKSLEVENEKQTGRWVLTPTEIKTLVNKYYNYKLFIDFKDPTSKIKIDTEKAFCALSKDDTNSKNRILKSPEMRITKYRSSQTGRSRGVFIGDSFDWGVRTTNRNFEFDENGFVATRTRREAVILQELNFYDEDTLVFLNNEYGEFFGDHRLRGIKLSNHDSKKFLKILDAAIKLKESKQNVKKKRYVRTIISYIAWSFKKQDVNNNW